MPAADVLDPNNDDALRLTGPQSEFFALETKFSLFCGGFGSGKTGTLVAKALRDFSTFRGANVAIYSTSYDLLRLTVVPRIETALALALPPRAWTFNKSQWRFEVQGFGWIILRSLRNPSRIIGYETLRAHIDEIDILRPDEAEEAWFKISARNRQKLRGIPNRVSCYGTPEGYKFTYGRWGKQRLDAHGWVRASSYSNELNLPADYIPDLRRMYPAGLVEAYLEGRFTNLRGGCVYKNYDRQENGTAMTVESKERLHIGQDFNVMAMASVIHVIRDSRPIAVDEIVRAYDTPAMLDIVGDRYPNNPITFYPDASGRSSKSTDASKSDIGLIRKAGYPVKVDPANPRVKDRILSMNAAFCNAQGQRRYLVNVDKCPNYAAALEQQAWGENGEPEKTNAPDDPSHHNEAAGYFIHKRFPIRRREFSASRIRGL